MENASKALIISGAILLSILIIALGIYVFNMAKGATKTNSLDELEIQTFNEPFESYEGRQIGTSVKALLNKVITSNTQNAGAVDRLPAIFYYKGSGSYNTTDIKPDSSNTKTEDIAKLRDGIANSHYYLVKFHIASNGLINGIGIHYDSNTTNDLFKNKNMYDAK